MCFSGLLAMGSAILYVDLITYKKTSFFLFLNQLPISSLTKHFMSRICLMQVLPEQVTPASCWWVQLLCFPHPSCLQFQIADSLPRQETWSIQMRPEPPLELVHPVALMKVGHPNCLQITETSSMSQPLLHTVPHSSWTFTSTLPEHLFSPATSLSSLSVPPVTMDKGSNWSRSKEQVENYYALDYLLIFQIQVWETFLDLSIHGTIGKCNFIGIQIQILVSQASNWTMA